MGTDWFDGYFFKNTILLINHSSKTSLELMIIHNFSEISLYRTSHFSSFLIITVIACFRKYRNKDAHQSRTMYMQ